MNTMSASSSSASGTSAAVNAEVEPGQYRKLRSPLDCTQTMETVVLTAGSRTIPRVPAPLARTVSSTKSPKLSAPTLQHSTAGTPSRPRSIAAFAAQPPTWVETESTARSVPGVGTLSAGDTITSVVTLPMQSTFFIRLSSQIVN